MRPALVLLVVGVLAGSRRGIAQDAAQQEGETPWSGVLPDPSLDRLTPIATQAETQRTCKWLVVRVLDAQTGRPVRGARLSRTPEWIVGSRRRHDVVMSVAVTDADGIAGVPSAPDAWNDASHWLVSAPGYATAYEYAALPPDEILLERGVRVVGRVLDALGRPVPEARIENLGGCSHGTAAARATTDSDGVFTFGRIRLEGQYWIEGRAGASELFAVTSVESLGSIPTDVVLGPCRRYEGRVVDLLGEPMADVVVRANNAERGPVTVSGIDGRFVLDGAAPGADLRFDPPAEFDAQGANYIVHDVWPDAPATVVVTPRGVSPGAEETATVEVRAVRSDGAAEPDVRFRLVHAESGRGPASWTARDAPKSADDPPLGVAREQVAPGSYRVFPCEPFSEWTFDPVAVTAAAGAKAEATIAVRAQPRLRVLGDLPESADVELAVALPGRQDAEIVSGDAWLPADCPAALRVTPKGGPPFFFPVGPAKDGFRDVHVESPSPRRVVLPADAKDAKLLDGPREVLAHDTDDGFETWAGGKLAVRFTDGSGRLREASVDLGPVAAGGAVRVDPATAAVVEEQTVVRLVGRGEGGAERELERKEVAPGEMVVFRADGLRTMRAVAPASGEVVLRRGTAALRLTVRDAAGSPVDALALVADEVYAAPKGTFEIAGFDAGTIRVVVARRDHLGRGVELHLVLEAGRFRERAVELPE